MNAGGACIGCTMPGFPDKFTPFYKAPPGSLVSSTVSRMVGSFIRPLREYSNDHLNREVRWDLEGHVPSGWARQHSEPGPVQKLGHRFYDRLRRTGDGGQRSGETWGRRDEVTLRMDPAVERELPGGEDEQTPAKEGR
jgi:hydrogenase small subunit